MKINTTQLLGTLCIIVAFGIGIIINTPTYKTIANYVIFGFIFLIWLKFMYDNRTETFLNTLNVDKYMEGFKEYDVVMLPSDKCKIGTIMKSIKQMPFHDKDIDIEVGQLTINQNHNVTETNEYWQPQHLYILSDDEIKEGDWCMGITSNIFKSDGSCEFKGCKKIVATTDFNITIEVKPCMLAPHGADLEFPEPSPQFIKEFVRIKNENLIGDKINKAFLKITDNFVQDFLTK